MSEAKTDASEAKDVVLEMNSAKITDNSNTWWCTGLPNDSVINDLKVYTSKLHLLATEFRKAKYCVYYLKVAGPVDELYESIMRPEPPSDVMVATLSGCIKTLLKQIQGLKRGKEAGSRFRELSSEAQTSLITLVKSIQSSMRTFRDLQAKGKEKMAHVRSASKTSAASAGTTPESNMRVIKEHIDYLMQPPEPDHFLDKMTRALYEFPFSMILAFMSMGGGLGIFICGSYYLGLWNPEERDLSYYFPLGMFLLGVAIVVFAYKRQEKSSDMNKWLADYQFIINSPSKPK